MEKRIGVNRVPVRRAPSADRNVSGREQGLDRQRDGDGGALRIRQRRVPAEDRNGRDGLHVHVRQLREPADGESGELHAGDEHVRAVRRGAADEHDGERAADGVRV